MKVNLNLWKKPSSVDFSLRFRKICESFQGIYHNEFA